MRLTKLIYSTLFFITATSLGLKAQDTKTTEKKTDEKAVTEEIEVVRPYKPILAEAVKLRRSPDLNDIKTYKAKFNYSLTDRKLELNSDINKLQAQEVVAEKQEELINNYIKGGFGSAKTIFGEAYINLGRDEAMQAGGYFQHFSQSGKLNKQQSSQQKLSVFGRSIGDVVTLSGRVNFQRNGLYFYGIDKNNPTLNPDPEKQTLNFFEAEGELVNKYTEDPDALSYALKLNGYIWSDKFNAKENSVVLNGYVNKRISKFNLGLAASTEFGSTKDELVSVGNNLLKLNPYIRLQASGVKITAGINFVQEFGAFSSSRIFPAVTADFTLIPDYLQIFGEVKGDVNRSSLKQFSDENPFLNNNITIRNSIEKLSISGGIKGTGGPGFGYKARVYHKSIEDMPLFVNNFSNFNKFDVIYDFGTMKLIGIEGELSVQVSDALKWTGKLNFEDYKPAAETQSWFKPQMRLSSDLSYVINKKVTLNASVALQDDSKAKIYTAAPANPYYTPDPANETVVTVKGFVDLGAGVSYKINNKFSAFARANNLLNSSYSRYLHYEVIGLNVFGGISYSF
ncbi:TonB-dependent receptor [Pedobacter panaciterrae]|jgi:Outer membrane receptor proteins, mostly Fe transport|uniref:TonB-dependent receptor n=1 Tax=Pedobacter panaciterrae TaxID=363849 RepID=A0ABU8NWR6_9SPHI|nr:TonB-dependent receptor [Pedobacter panaciterrae]NQX52287.1 TonB-dependent receptor [Pedobacter panaciterrae]